MQVQSDRVYRFDAPTQTVWDALGRVEEYRRWWPWLRRFEAVGLVSGDQWHCTIRPPLPYALKIALVLDEVEEPHRVAATVSGDLGGNAEVTIEPNGAGCEVRLVSTLAPRNGVLRAVAEVTPWLARFGHDWVLDTGLRQFRRRAL